MTSSRSQRAFHGRTYGSLSATPQESKQAPFAPLVPGFRAVAPEVFALREAVDERTAAVILEPVQGEGGVHVLPDELLRAAREACDEFGATLIFDEVQCGLGRTGTLWAYEHSGVVPDLMTSAKALGGGLPIGALITGPRLASGFEPGDHGSTFAGNPVVCAAALAVLDVVEDETLLARVRERGELLLGELAELPGVSEARGRGFFLAIELRDGGAPALVERALAEQRLLLNATGPTDRAAAARADDLRRRAGRGARPPTPAALLDPPAGATDLLSRESGCLGTSIGTTRSYCPTTRRQIGRTSHSGVIRPRPPLPGALPCARCRAGDASRAPRIARLGRPRVRRVASGLRAGRRWVGDGRASLSRTVRPSISRALREGGSRAQMLPLQS